MNKAFFLSTLIKTILLISLQFLIYGDLKVIYTLERYQLSWRLVNILTYTIITSWAIFRIFQRTLKQRFSPDKIAQTDGRTDRRHDKLNIIFKC